MEPTPESWSEILLMASRNPVNSPLEVGSWNPMIYKVFIHPRKAGCSHRISNEPTVCRTWNLIYIEYQQDIPVGFQPPKHELGYDWKTLTKKKPVVYTVQLRRYVHLEDTRDLFSWLGAITWIRWFPNLLLWLVNLPHPKVPSPQK